MYADTTNQGIGARTSLASPEFRGVPEACVTFAYFTSKKMGRLEVWLHSWDDPDDAVLLRRYDAPFDTWNGARLVLVLCVIVFHQSAC